MNKKNLIVVSVILILIFLFIGVLFINDFKIVKEKESVRFGYSYNSGQLPGLIGVEEDIFNEYNLNVEGKIFNGGKDIIEAFLAREIDFGLSSAGNIIPAVSKTNELVIIAGTSYGGGRKRVMIRNDLDIKDPLELKGRRIAVKIGGTQHKNLIKLIDRLNLSESDFEILNMKDSDAMFALQTKGVDAYFCGEPTCATIEHNKIGYELINFKNEDVDPNFLIVRRSYLEKNRNETITFLKAWIDSENFVNNNLEASKSILSREGRINPEIVNTSLKHISFTPYLEQFMIDGLKEDGLFLLSQKNIENLPDYDLLINTELLEEVKNEDKS